MLSTPTNNIEVVVFHAGLNDLLKVAEDTRNSAVKDVEAEVRRVIRLCRDRGLKLAICSIPPVAEVARWATQVNLVIQDAIKDESYDDAFYLEIGLQHPFCGNWHRHRCKSCFGFPAKTSHHARQTSKCTNFPGTLRTTGSTSSAAPAEEIPAPPPQVRTPSTRFGSVDTQLGTATTSALPSPSSPGRSLRCASQRRTTWWPLYI